MAEALHQMTVSYSPQEDRLLLRFGTKTHVEFRLWLTRRIVGLLWGTLVKTVEKAPEVTAQPEPRVRQAMLAMRHQEAVEGGDFSQKPDPEAQPIADNERPFLVVGLEARAARSGRTTLIFTVEGGKDVRLSLDDSLIHLLCHLLVTGATNAKWGLDLSVADPAVIAATAATGRQVH